MSIGFAYVWFYKGKLFSVFEDFYASGTQDAEVIKSLHIDKRVSRVNIFTTATLYKNDL